MPNEIWPLKVFPGIKALKTPQRIVAPYISKSSGQSECYKWSGWGDANWTERDIILEPFLKP